VMLGEQLHSYHLGGMAMILLGIALGALNAPPAKAG
jgi:drug/metabolite transporter (DMT)-like permease